MTFSTCGGYVYQLPGFEPKPTELQLGILTATPQRHYSPSKHPGMCDPLCVQGVDSVANQCFLSCRQNIMYARVTCLAAITSLHRVTLPHGCCCSVLGHPPRLQLLHSAGWLKHKDTPSCVPVTKLHPHKAFDLCSVAVNRLLGK